jgi:hypothetical protein
MTLLEPSVMSHVKTLTAGGKWKDLPWKVLPKNFTEGLNLCKFSCNRSALSGIYVRDNIMVATDELRINWSEMEDKIEPFWIADPAVGELMGMSGLKESALTDSWIHFRAEDGTVFSCKRLQDAKYPFEKLQGLVDSHEKGKEDISNDLPTTLSEAVELASVLSIEIDAHPTVRLTFKPDCIEVYSQRSSGKYQEKVAWDKPIKAEFEPIVLYVDYSMITYGLKRSKSFYIKQTKTKSGKVNKRIIFQGEHIRHILSTFQVDKE